MRAIVRKGSRNFRLDRCTPGPVKLVPTPAKKKGVDAGESVEEGRNGRACGYVNS